MTNQPVASPLPKQDAYRFPDCPDSWHYLASLRDLKRGLVSLELSKNASFVGYRTESGRVVVLDGRCSHVGSNLAHGTIAGECLRCPLHGWEYDIEGRCVHIPGSETIPNWARQCSYPVHEVAGHVFFFNKSTATFPFPTFEGADWTELLASRPFELLVDAPWYIVSSNAFDLQHFRSSHDRALVEEPVVDDPHPMARRIVAKFRVAGKSVWDALTRRFSGPQVTLTMVDWAGSLIFTSANFTHAATHSIVTLQPLDGQRALARVIVFLPHSRSRLGRWIFDPLSAEIRRLFIRRFLQPDVNRLAGLRYDRQRLIGLDHVLRGFLEWLEILHQ